jgi:Protein of unknown function (DUF998)
MAGPAAFTAAWAIGSLRQSGYPAVQLQISGLAAPDARDPWIMMAGFVVLGGCTAAFGTALEEALGGPGQAGPAPRMIQGAGLLTIAAGLLRRDHMLLIPGPASWHNQAHDAISAVIYSDLVLAQLLLAARLGRAPRGLGAARWQAWRPWLLGSAAATAAVLIPFAADTSGPAAGILQRIAVSIPLAAMAAIAGRMVTMARVESQAPRNG